MYILQFDGQFQEHAAEHYSNSSHAGLMGYGWLIYKNDHQVAHGWGAFAQGKHAASNLAEYLALIEGLEALRDMGIKNGKVEIRGDARSVLDQMAGHTPVHSHATQPFYQRAIRLVASFTEVKWVWVPRRNNKKADYLSRQAIRQMAHTPDKYEMALDMIVPGFSKLMPVFDLRVYQPAG